MKRLLVFIGMPMPCSSPASGDEVDEGLPRERARADEAQRPGRDPHERPRASTGCPRSFAY